MTGLHIAKVLETFPLSILLNTQEPTGGVLGPTFFTTTMVERKTVLMIWLLVFTMALLSLSWMLVQPKGYSNSLMENG